MSVSHLQAWAENKAEELIRKYNKNGDDFLTKEDLPFFLHTARGSTQLNKQGSVSKIPKTNDNVEHKLSANAHIKPKDQLQDKAKKSSTKLLGGKTSNMPLNREQMKEIFKYHDSDKDDFLNIRELTKVFCFLGSIVPFHKAQYALACVDTNEDGLINETEFDKLIDYASKIIKKK